MALIREKQLSEIWLEQRFDTANLLTEDGRPLTVLYPGRLNDDRGGDFCDATLALGNKTLSGQVELHVKPSDWTAHGHHRDPNYNNVVLHVVYSHGTQATTSLQNGTKVPILAIEERVPYSELGSSPDSGPVTKEWPRGHRCHWNSEKAILFLIESAGEARFIEKSSAFLREIPRFGPGQTLYQGIMVALGYSRNKLPFLELSKRVSLDRLESLASQHLSDALCARSLDYELLKTSGLLDSLDSQNAPSASAIDVCQTPGQRAMPNGAWHGFRARPCNSPQVRIAAMSRLIVRYRDQGLLQGLIGALLRADRDKASILEDAIIMRPQTEVHELLGRERARDIIINVILPFYRAFGLFCGKPQLCARALSIYRAYPRSGSNCIERHMMGQLGLPRKAIDSARRQQGLLHVYSSSCARGRCTNCWLSKLESGDNVQVETVPATSQ